MAGEGTLYVEKSFEYCVIRWSIKNFTLMTCPDELVMFSPEFTVRHPQETRWRLGLKTMWTIDRENCLSFLLQRLDPDTGPETVWVNWRVCAINYVGKELFSVDCESYFERERMIEIDVPDVKKLCNDIVDCNPNVIVFICEMMVDHHHDDARKLRDINIGFDMESISRDLRRLYNRGTMYDVVMKTCDNYLRAHKAILAARNKKSCRCVSEGAYLNFSNLETDALERVLRYFYSGNVQYIVVSPTIALFKCIQFFDMKDFIQYLAGREYNLLSKFKTRKYDFTWRIRGIMRSQEDCFRTEYLRDDDGNEVWQLHLFPRGIERNASHIDLFIEYVRGPESIDVIMNFDVIDSSDLSVIGRRMTGIIDVGETFEVKGFISRDFLGSVLQDGDLVIAITLRVALKKYITATMDEIEEPSPSTVPARIFYTGLSINMNQLFEVGSFSDITLKSRDKYFPVHRCVLSARSKRFSELLTLPCNDILELSIDADILRIILKYMYSGSLERVGIEDLKRIYDTAIAYGIPSLKHNCSQQLKEALAPNTMIDILIYADNNNDQELKSASLDFIWKSQRQSREEASWGNLANENPGLLEDILSYFQLQESDDMNTLDE